MALRFVLCVAVAAVVLNNANAISEEEKENIKGIIKKFIGDCSQEFGITEEQLNQWKETKTLDGINSCAIACFFKKTKFLTDDGKFDNVFAKEIGPKYLSNDGDQKKYNDMVENCASVNDEAMSDGDKGCERARLLAKCIGKYKAELNI